MPVKKPMQSTVLSKSASSSIGKLSEHNMSTIVEIGELFELAHSTIKSVAKSCNTRNAIKNGYQNLKKGIAGSRILEFSKIGKNGEDISINLRLDHGKYQKTIIIIGNEPFVINSKGQIEKNPSVRFVHDNYSRQKGDTIQYFSQDEIDNLDSELQFFNLKKELKKYLDYILLRKKQINELRYKKSDSTHGNLNKYQKTIDDINEKFKFFKKNINKLAYNSLDKDLFRIINKIKTFHAQNSILFKDAMPDGRALYLVYSKINKKQAMKVFVMDYNNKDIDKSFIMYDNKLAKFSPKRVNQKQAHLNYDFHYYTQEEIDNSSLTSYLKIIDERLTSLTDNLKDGIRERFGK